MDDFTHQPEIRLFVFTEAAQRAEKVRVDAIGHVEPQAVDAEFVHPHPDCAEQVARHLRIAQV